MECSIGIHTETECHKLTYNRSSVLHDILEFTEQQITLISLRSACTEIKNICTFHKTEYLDKYFHINGKSCSDPFSCHTKPVKKSLQEISLTLSTSSPNLKLIPGRALCTKCLNKI